MGLPIPDGPYKVSTLDLEVPATDPQVFGAEQYQIDGKPVFRLETISVTIYYPAESTSTSSSGASWLPPPRIKSVEGLIKYGGISRYFSWPAALALPFFTRLPYATDAPLALPNNSSPSSSSPSPRFSVAVFSHGLAGSRTTYSHYLASLASHGIVVAAVEHRDGSAPATTTYRSRHAEPETRVFFKHDELDPPASSTGEVMDMRRMQLRLRQAEVLGALAVLRDLDAGRGQELAARDTLPVSTKTDLSLWKGRLDLPSVWMLGHSFGGATAIELLRRGGAFRHGLVLDPWLEPVNEGGPTLERPLYVINSEAFTVWKTHFARLRRMVAGAQRRSGAACWLLTMSKTKHTDFSDYPLVMPRMFSTKVDPKRFHKLLTEASVKQLTTSEAVVGSIGVDVREEISGEVEARDLGEPGQVINHPLTED